MSKSISVSPPAAWLVSDASPCSTRVSGYRGGGCAVSATSATRLTKAIAAAKSSNCQVADDLVALEHPLRAGQPGGDLVVVSSGGVVISLPPMRIVSLVPSATEMLFALGLGDDLIAVTHECDYPPAALDLPRITRDKLPAGLTAAEIDAAVKERTLDGESIYELDTELLHELQPELIVTQALCKVCAVSYDDVRAIAEEIESQPMVIALDPHTVGEVLGDARTMAQATDTKDEAVDLIRESSARIDRIRLAVRGARRPRVVALEWLDPPYAAGHWTPQLIEYAGGEDVLGFAGEHSEERSWELIAAAEAGHRDRDAVRVRRRDRPPRGGDAARAAGSASAPARSSPSTGGVLLAPRAADHRRPGVARRDPASGPGAPERRRSVDRRAVARPPSALRAPCSEEWLSVVR